MKPTEQKRESMNEKVEHFLTRRSYRKYPQRIEYPYTIKNLYEHRLTDLETTKVCETNDRLSIHITEYGFLDHEVKYEVSITAELNSIWWELKAYSFSGEELMTHLESVENNLIRMFNNITK